MTFDPKTNRIPTGLLTPEELAALQAAKHGWEFTAGRSGSGWQTIDRPSWVSKMIYRALPEPVTKPHVPNEVERLRAAEISVRDAAVVLLNAYPQVPGKGHETCMTTNMVQNQLRKLAGLKGGEA